MGLIPEPSIPSFSGSSNFGIGYNKINAESNNAFNKINAGLGITAGNYGGQTIANYGGFSATKPVIENYSPQSFPSSNNFGTSVGLYGNSGLYKKELNLGSGGNLNNIQNNYLQSSYAGGYQESGSIRSENYDCVCVPYNQCPSHDVIGRKDDYYLAIDPRNLKSDIDAITEERVITDGNGTMTVVRVPKDAINQYENKTEESKTVTKREAPLEKTGGGNKTHVEPVRESFYCFLTVNSKILKLINFNKLNILNIRLITII